MYLHHSLKINKPHNQKCGLLKKDIRISTGGMFTDHWVTDGFIVPENGFHKTRVNGLFFMSDYRMDLYITDWIYTKDSGYRMVFTDRTVSTGTGSVSYMIYGQNDKK